MLTLLLLLILPLEAVRLADFGGIPNDGIPDDAPMRAAIRKAIITTYPDYRQLPIELDFGNYDFNEPIEWLPTQSYSPSLILVGKGSESGHPAYDNTVLTFHHTDERPCIRVAGNGARLEGFAVVAPDTSYVAVELGNDAWPGRVNEPSFKGDLTCNRSLIRNVATWHGQIGVSVRTWGPTTLDRVKSQHSKTCIRLAGNSIVLRDCHLKPNVDAVSIEFGRSIKLDGGAIENGLVIENGVKRTRCAGVGVRAQDCEALEISSVYFESMPAVASLVNCHGITITGLMALNVPVRGSAFIGDTQEPTRGVLVDLTNCSNYVVTGGRLLGRQLFKVNVVATNQKTNL